MEKPASEPLRLTQYSHGSGCGCKIAPMDLERILQHVRTGSDDPKLLVGNKHGDDASIVDIGDGRGLVSTTDFFMPIVDSPYDFGRIAAANAISDVYAMGATPLTALAILGWPIESLGTEAAGQVLEGARSVADTAGISIAGGHSIESKEPFFGLSVSGLIDHSHVKQNQGAKEGDLLFLTKPIGVGMLSTAMKRGMLDDEAVQQTVEQMAALNDVGPALGRLKGVHAMTDVTGFGLLGHLIEVCEASRLSAIIELEHVPVLLPDHLNQLMAKFVMPDNTMRNFKAYQGRVSTLGARPLQLLCDPQTSGGLLIAVDPALEAQVEQLLAEKHCHAKPIGRLIASTDPLIEVR